MPSMDGAVLMNGATASGLERAEGIVAVGEKGVWVGGILVEVGSTRAVQVGVGGKAVLDGNAVLITMVVADDIVAGVSVTGAGMVWVKTVACVRLIVGNTNGVGDFIGRLQAASIKISATPSVQNKIFLDVLIFSSFSRAKIQAAL